MDKHERLDFEHFVTSAERCANYGEVVSAYNHGQRLVERAALHEDSVEAKAHRCGIESALAYLRAVMSGRIGYVPSRLTYEHVELWISNRGV